MPPVPSRVEAAMAARESHPVRGRIVGGVAAVALVEGMGLVLTHPVGTPDELAFRTDSTDVPGTTEPGTTPGSTPGSTGPHGTEVPTTPPTTEAPNPSQALRDALTPQTVDQDKCLKIVGEAGSVENGKDKKIIKLHIGATAPVDAADPSKRRYSDAVDTPLLSDKADKEALKHEIEARICSDPLIAGEFANLLANTNIDGTSVIDLDPWLKGYEGDPEVVNDKVAEFVPGLDADRSLAGKTDQEIKDMQKKEADANYAFQSFAGKLVTILDNFENLGNQDAGMTVFNVALKGDGTQVGGIPDLKAAADQFLANGDRSAVEFRITTKSGNVCVFIFGFDTADNRVEKFECPAPPAPEQPTQPSIPTGSIPNNSTTTRPTPSTTTVRTSTTPAPSTTSTVKPTTTVTTAPKGEEPHPNPSVPK